MSEVAERVRFKSREAEPVVCLKQRSVGEERGKSQQQQQQHVL